VLYLHGRGGMIQEVQATGLVEQIARNHRLIVIDRPGFGHSARPRDRTWTPEEQADLIAKLLSKLGVSKVIVIAYSWVQWWPTPWQSTTPITFWASYCWAAIFSRRPDSTPRCRLPLRHLWSAT
jgi:pimeloyl-ACP methyl ester carboxylesterase